MATVTERFPPAKDTGLRSALTATLLLSIALATAQLHPGHPAAPVVPLRRAIWITRWDYRTAEDVHEIVGRCADAGFDTLLFQVRGNATTFYPSHLEPWAEELDFQDPGFDPLALACLDAERRGVAIHAWVNAIPGWRGAEPPRDPTQLYHRQPSWFLYDQQGRRQPLQPDYYVALNPCLPAVRDHIAGVCEELARRYPVQGIHLDYIRFLEPDPEHDYPRDPVTLELFRRETGRLPDEDPRRWRDWKTEQVTRLVREIDRRLAVERPDLLLTAAVIRTPSRARQLVHQDWTHWLRRGFVDAVFPMQYDQDDERFAQRTRLCLRAAGGRPVFMGIGAYLHRDPRQTRRQIRLAEELGCAGTSLFTYSTFFASPAPPFEDPAPTAELRARRREIVLGEGRD